ncbi:hypothetical protein BH23THE1_BH23THE1_11500 [soil metagenome]
MEEFVDSMMQTPEGLELYDEVMLWEYDLEDTTLIPQIATGYLYHYYTHMFYQLYMTDPCALELDTLNEDLCYNGDFTLSDPEDDFLEGYRLYSGLFKGSVIACTHDCQALKNLPLPERSYPDHPEYPFNLDPNDNKPPSFGFDINRFNYHRIEMFESGSGVDNYVPTINKNPPSGSRSIRLNRDWRYAHTNTMERTFRVEEKDSILWFSFAVVLEDPNHNLHNQPYFLAAVLDSQGNTIDEICYVSDPNDERMNAGIMSGRYLTYRDWDCTFFNLENYIDSIVTLRFVAAGCKLGAHFGYAYVADICVECPQVKINPNDQFICPKEFPLEYCGMICVDTSVYSIDTVYLQIVRGDTVYATIPYISYDPETGEVCFEISETEYNSLPALGFDVIIVAEITHIVNNNSTVIKSVSSYPNTEDDQFNDIIKYCCPMMEMYEFENYCIDEEQVFCGTVSLDTCENFDVMWCILFKNGDSIFAEIPVEIDSLGDFCCGVPDSIMMLLQDTCYEVLLTAKLNDTINMISYNFSCPMDTICRCCPEAGPFTLSFNKFLCLVGGGYTQLVFDISGNLPINQFPSGFSYCNEPFEIDGGYIDFMDILVQGPNLVYRGLLHVTDESKIYIAPDSSLYMLGSIVLCDSSGVRCEYQLKIPVSMGQASMCLEMDGYMCGNFIANTSPYNPNGSSPPYISGGNVYLPIRIQVPFIGKIATEEDTCWINQYWFEFYGVKGSSIGEDLLHDTTITQQGAKTTRILSFFLIIDVNDWNQYEHIKIKFWNNCGDTCIMATINVIPVQSFGGDPGMSKLYTDNNIHIFPNPTSSDLTIKYQLLNESTQIVIYHPSGQIMYQTRLTGQKGNHLIEMDSWKPGVYFLEVQDSFLEKQIYPIIKD